MFANQEGGEERDCRKKGRQAQGEGGLVALAGAWATAKRLGGLVFSLVVRRALPHGFLRSGLYWLKVFRYCKTRQASFLARASALISLAKDFSGFCL